jgi:hypothetical protein
VTGSQLEPDGAEHVFLNEDGFQATYKVTQGAGEAYRKVDMKISW